jgi:hypothetical protein
MKYDDDYTSLYPLLLFCCYSVFFIFSFTILYSSFLFSSYMSTCFLYYILFYSILFLSLLSLCTIMSSWLPKIPFLWHLSLFCLQYAFQQPGAKASETELHSWVVRSGAVHSFQMQTITASNFEDLRHKFRFVPLGTTSASKIHHNRKLVWHIQFLRQLSCNSTSLHITVFMLSFIRYIIYRYYRLYCWQS